MDTSLFPHLAFLRLHNSNLCDMDACVSSVIIQVVTVLCVAVTTEAEIKIPFGGIPELSKVALYQAWSRSEL